MDAGVQPVDPRLGGEVGVESKPEEAAVEEVVGGTGSGELERRRRGVVERVEYLDPSRLLGDEDPAVRAEPDRGGDVQPRKLGHHLEAGLGRFA